METLYRKHRRTEIAELREVTQSDINVLNNKDKIPEYWQSRISISKSDRENGSPKIGDMIARNPKNHDDQWLVAEQYYKDNFAPMDNDPTAQLNVKSLEEIRDTVAKNRGYENWEILNGSDLYDSDIDEVAKMYSESKTAQLQADKAELLSALEKCWEVVPLDTYERRRWFDEIESLIQKHKK